VNYTDEYAIDSSGDGAPRSRAELTRARAAEWQEAKAAGNSSPIVMVTAYDALSARIAEEADVDLILVGDSAATTILGYDNTRDVDVAELLVLTRAARRGARRTLLVGDLPFGTYEASDALAVATARRFVQEGADFVKLEGGGEMCDRVRAIVADGIPVIGHVGLLPQGAATPAALRAQGRSARDAMRILDDALALEAAGAELLVVEAVPSLVGTTIAARCRIPIVGIGAGNSVDGQVLVYTDILGLGHGRVPRFVRQYADAHSVWLQAVLAFARDVRSRDFPSTVEGYGMPEDEARAFREMLHSE
jgi:3-methyl-2-oxobutanoate hydroxymethyltransferase